MLWLREKISSQDTSVLGYVRRVALKRIRVLSTFCTTR
jgi:hypothetical protein